MSRELNAITAINVTRQRHYFPPASEQKKMAARFMPLDIKDCIQREDSFQSTGFILEFRAPVDIYIYIVKEMQMWPSVRL